MKTNDLIAEMTENVNKYGSENMTTYLMVQAIAELRRVDAELDRCKSVLNATSKSWQEDLATKDAELATLQAQIPGFTGLPKRKLDELMAQGFRINGFAIERDVAEKEAPIRGFVTIGGFVGWWLADATAELDTLRAQVEALTDGLICKEAALIEWFD